MKVKFVPQNVEFDIKPGQSVMHVAQDNGLYIKSVCKGVPSCAECRVRIVDGDFNVLPPGSEELALIGTGHFIDHRRLSCQLKCFGDITVDLHEQLQKEQGLLGGRKSKTKTVKDDRVEDAHAIRVSDRPDSEDEEEDNSRGGVAAAASGPSQSAGGPSAGGQGPSPSVGPAPVSGKPRPIAGKPRVVIGVPPTGESIRAPSTPPNDPSTRLHPGARSNGAIYPPNLFVLIMHQPRSRR